MTDKRTTPDAAAGGRRRKRAAPTIDLTATEVPAAEAAAPASQQPSKEPPVQEPPEPKHSEPEHPQAAHDTASAAATGGAAGGSGHWLGLNLTGPALTGGIAGALIMSLVLFALWLTGLVPIRYAGSTATRARVTTLEMQLHDLQKRPAPAADTQAVDTQVLEAFGQRVAKMEEAIAKIPADIRASVAAIPSSDPGLADRVAAADNAMKALGVALTALNRRSDDIAANAAQARERAEAAEKAVTDLRASVQDVSKTASAGASSAELGSLQTRIAALEQSAKAAREELGKVVARTSAPDQAARLALSAALLRDVVTRGVPFTGELAQAKALGAEEKTLAPLASFAATGLPSEKALAQELSALLSGMLKAAGAQAPSGGFLDRLQANAGQLVKIRPVDAPPGDAPADVLARIELAAVKADIAGALADLGKLPESARQPAAAWAARAQARQQALAAAQQFAADTARALGPR